MQNGALIIRVIPSVSTSVAELMAGTVDVMEKVDPDQLEMLMNSESVNIVATPGKNLSALAFVDYAQNSLFSDIRLRQAVCYALDMDAINAALYGSEMETARSLIPACMQGGDYAGYEPIGYDVEKAKALMAEAGYPDGFEFTLLANNQSNSYSASEQLATQIQAELAKINITVNVEILSWSEYVDRIYIRPVEGYDALLYGWNVDYNDISNVMELFSSDEAAGGSNFSGYADADYDGFIAAARNASSYDEATEYYIKAAQKLNEDVPSYILGHYAEHVAASAAILNPGDTLGGWGVAYWQVQKAG